ncbi:hypothetical protein KEM56_007801 [Ascosphaera pollenicola]|nr:hypothetical protein KEM56_007801 [Ascosphaera pollenicola]
MLFKNVLLSTLAAAAIVVFADDAPVVKGSTPDFFRADIPPHAGPIAGELNIGPGSNGEGVRVELSFDYFKNSSVSYYYHIHEHQLPANGSCSAAGGHLDPFKGVKTCDPDRPGACQIGDLSGKHGALNESTANQVYFDKYLSTSHTDKSFVGGRSLVIHDAKMTQVACVNITKYMGTDDPVQVGGQAKVPVRFRY